tara:strand:+ start:79 stop:351 length:273 start_codon:yes stop_codon:yes gene_type:complete
LFLEKINDILYIEAAGNYSKVVLKNDSILVRDKISSLLEKISTEKFIQVHKSFIVAIEHINSLEGNRILIGNNTIPIGKMYKSNIINLIK